MFRRLKASTPRALVKRCVYALALAVPGSLVVFGLYWLVRLVRAQILRMDA